MLLELFVLDVDELLCEPVRLAALPAASVCAPCCSCDSSEDVAEVLLLEELPCNADARSPALDSNCCRLMLLPPPDNCENNASAWDVLLAVPLLEPVVAWLKKLLNSLSLTLPSPLASIEANSSSSVCDRLEELLVLPAPFVLLVPNSEL